MDPKQPKRMRTEPLGLPPTTAATRRPSLDRRPHQRGSLVLGPRYHCAPEHTVPGRVASVCSPLGPRGFKKKRALTMRLTFPGNKERVQSACGSGLQNNDILQPGPLKTGCTPSGRKESRLRPCLRQVSEEGSDRKPLFPPPRRAPRGSSSPARSSLGGLGGARAAATEGPVGRWEGRLRPFSRKAPPPRG